MNKLSRSDIFNYAFYMFTDSLVVVMPLGYMSVFLTDNLMMSAALMGTLILVARLVDTVVGILSGGIIQRAREKGTMYSKWITATRWIVSVGVILMFTNTTGTPMAVRCVLSFIAYCMVNCSMNFVQTSQFNILAVMGGASMENRNKLAFRGTQFVAAASILSSLITVPLITGLQPVVGSAYSYMIVSVIYAIPYIFGCHFLAKACLKYERASTVSVGPSIPVREMVKSVVTNSQLLILLVVNSISYMGTFIIMTLAAYYFIYVLGNFMLMAVSMTISTVFGLFAAIVGPKVGVRLGKKRAMVIGLLVGVIGQLLIFFFARNSVVPYVIIGCCASLAGYFYLGFGANYVLDCGEYHFHKTGKDNRAVAMGMMTFPIKIGLIVGGAVGSFGLAVIGYTAGMAPSPDFVSNFMIVFSLIPAALSFIAMLVMLFGYHISDADAARYAKENAERAAAYVAAKAAADSAENTLPSN
ncbi:Na+/melibiose symporter [Sporobacter termitidis DSM 10068]|uniref:Na+/melibiose symporter n=1 Tax=Sporobacter termitidis DSM 10068 TaxID=1123282 RepID=A0A1M5ZBM9_9FIRM|nr:MFS transporter [Sporobacter termitidis]SHI21636.1 Na+/melibiose symporter [Sporobacter termitidis DSM 10068]